MSGAGESTPAAVWVTHCQVILHPDDVEHMTHLDYFLT